ncbi:MAG: DUF6080 domain-containing protein [Methylococcaceae bacterium]|nr:DUF6080 domain-containing protein [Methylococcaceae bacterium]MDP3018580.1 DUF6080 domain-containing protein [Methylococcaceae bacterium]
MELRHKGINVVQPFVLRKIDLYLAVFLLVFAFFISYSLELKFYHLGVFNQWDTLFDSDPVSALSDLGNGWGGGRTGFAHPNFAYYFSLPIRGITKILALVLESDEFAIRKQLALLLLPLASALQASFIYLILRRLILTTLQALLMTLVAIVSFSQLIFGSIPDSFGLSSLVITMGILLMSYAFQAKTRRPFWAWVVLGAFGAGITITNILPISILQLFSSFSIEKNLKSALLKTIAGSIIAIVVTFFLAFLGNQIYNRDNYSFFDNASRKEALTIDPINRFLKFPTTLGDTLFSSKPNIVTNDRAVKNKHKFQFMFTLGETQTFLFLDRWFAIVLLGLVAFGATVLIHLSHFDRNLASALLAIIFYNWIFNSFWGTELFLYSSHWFVPELLLLSGCLRSASINNHIKLAVGLIILTCITMNNTQTISFIFDSLTSAA